MECATDIEALHKVVLYYDAAGVSLSDVLDDSHVVARIGRYRAVLTHIAGHRRWSSAIFANNFSLMQRLAIEVFEDSRIESLIVREYPGVYAAFFSRCTRRAAARRRLRPGNGFVPALSTSSLSNLGCKS